MISVIITAYNVEAYIVRAIESALAQKGVDIEAIVVDDCSTDRTWQIVTALTDPRIKPIRLPANGGPSAARNAGFAAATGDWIAVLDGDDSFELARLQRCLSLATNADIIVDNLLVCREADGKEFPMFPALPAITPANFIKGTVNAGNNYTLGYLKPVFSRAFLQKHNLSYETSLRIGEDYQLLLQAVLIGARIATDQTPGYRYTARKGSISYRLKLADITAMRDADARIAAKYQFDPAASAEQTQRTKNLKTEYAYTKLIDAIKHKRASDIVQTAISCPASVWLLKRPLEVRLKRLLSGFNS